MFEYETIEVYREIPVLKYESEDGYRADFGTKRTKLVPTVQDARDLIDFYHNPPYKWGNE